MLIFGYPPLGYEPKPPPRYVEPKVDLREEDQAEESEKPKKYSAGRPRVYSVPEIGSRIRSYTVFAILPRAAHRRDLRLVVRCDCGEELEGYEFNLRYRVCKNAFHLSGGASATLSDSLRRVEQADERTERTAERTHVSSTIALDELRALYAPLSTKWALLLLGSAWEMMKSTPRARIRYCLRCGKTKDPSEFAGNNAEDLSAGQCLGCVSTYRGWSDKSLDERASAHGERVSPDPVGRVYFIPISGNKKTGPIPITFSEQGTCPDTCSFYSAGCYAGYGPTLMHWRGTEALGAPWEDFLVRVRDLKPGTLWRHNVAGDLPGAGRVVDVPKLSALVLANAGRRGFTFTHKPLLGPENAASAAAVKDANASGFTINLSADSLEQADDLYDAGLGPVAVVLPEDAPRHLRTPRGRVIATCPAQTSKLTCQTCELCANSRRKAIVGFRAHGQFKALVSELVRKKRTPAAKFLSSQTALTVPAGQG